MRKVKFFLTVLSLLAVNFALAQTLTVKGTVSDAGDKSPLVGAGVYVKGSTQGTSTDIDGTYTLTCDANATLVFSYVGYVDQEIQVNGKAVVNAALSADSESLEEVILTAYGPQTKKSFTGTAAVVKADQIQNLNVSSVSKALQGLASGVMVVSGTGQPGENATIRVRGVGSYSGSNDPLIVVDGVVYNGNLNSINPNDIESFTVLKDANSTALYGSRAANGVILITTKIGTPGKANFTVTANYGLSTRAVDDYEYLNAQQYMETQWAKGYKDAVDYGYTDQMAREYATGSVLDYLVYNPFSVNNPIGTDGKLVSNAQLLYEEDWYDVLFRTGQRQEYTIQATGGSKEVRYLVSGAYLNDEGLVKGSKFDRYSVRGKIDAQMTKWLKVGLNMGLSYSSQNYPTQGGTATRNSISWVRNTASIYPAYMRDRNGNFILDADGNKQADYGEDATVWGRVRPISSGSNPLGTFMYDEIVYNRFLSNNSGYLEAKFLKDFTFRSTVGVDYYLYAGKSYYNSRYGDGRAYGGRSSRDKETTAAINWTNTLTWDKTFDNKHHVNVLVGTEANTYDFENVEAEKRGFDFADTELTYGANLQTANSYTTASRNFRTLSRVNYDYDNKYHVSASFTYDGTSRFHSSSRWGSFWSVGLGWNMANEPWMEDIKWLNTLKLKASYGTSGNQNLGMFPYMATYSTGWNILGNLGSIIGTLGNNNLTWEKQGMLDLGFDFGMFENKLTGSLTYYNKKSIDLLMARPLPISAGITSYNDNIGEMTNYGVEFDVKGIVLQTKDMSWDLGMNISYQHNEISALPEEQAEGFNASNYKRIEVGKSRYSWYMQKYAGVDPQDGKPMWYKDVVDAEGNVTGVETTKAHSEATRYIVGDALPKYIGGISTNFAWKGLYVNVLASFALGHKVYDSDYAGLMHMFSDDRTGYQSSVDVLKRWQKPGDITSIPAINEMDYSNTSTAFLRKGDYLRLRNVTIGYDLSTIPAVKKAGFAGLKVYATGDNLATLFGTDGLDPEMGIEGLTNNNSSSLKVISFGVNLQF